MSSIIVACANNQVIGNKNDLPWYLPADLKHFKDLTTSHTVVMGRKTYESIHNRLGGPLPNRRNIVLSRSLEKAPEGVELSISIDALKKLVDINSPAVFIIGGEQIYDAAFKAGIVKTIFLTRVHANIPGDAHFPQLDDSWQQVSIEKHQADEKNKYDYDFVELRKTLDE